MQSAIKNKRRECFTNLLLNILLLINILNADVVFLSELKTGRLTAVDIYLFPKQQEELRLIIDG